MGAKLGPPDGCYIPVIDSFFPMWIVPINHLADEEDQPLSGELGSRTVDQEDRESLQWLASFFMANEDRAQNLEGFEELKARFMKSPSFLEMTQARFIEGQAAVLLRQLQRRFGDLPAAIEQRVHNAKPELLVRWTDRILDAQSLDDVFGDD